MRKTTIVVALIVIATALCVSAYAADGTCPMQSSWEGFWNSVGGALYNAMPWNWGSWAGK